MKTMTIEILRPVIEDAVATETNIKGVMDKSIDEKTVQAAYNEMIGDEAHYKRKIDRLITAHAESLVAEMSNMLSGNSNIATSYTDPTKIVITVGVDGRFNSSFSSTLARLGSEYITNKVLVAWFGIIPTAQGNVPFYENLAQTYLLNIRKCFNKLAPEAPQANGDTVSILDSKGTIQ